MPVNDPALQQNIHKMKQSVTDFEPQKSADLANF